MCELEVESPVIDVAFSTDCSSMAVLHRVGVSFFALEAKGPRMSSPRLVTTASFGKSISRLYDESLLQIAFSGPSEVQILLMTDDLELSRYDFASGTKAWLGTDAGSVATITTPCSASIEGVVAQHLSGKLSSISGGEHSPLPVQFPAFLPWASCLVHNGEFLAFGLSRNGHLYANSRLLTKNCTSFVVTDSHLIFTTSNHFVKFVHLASEQGKRFPRHRFLRHGFLQVLTNF
jgi:elongator complex protein 1